MSDFHRGYGESVTFDGPTIPANRFPPDCPLPIKLTVTLAVAEDNARRAFWRGWLAGMFTAVLVVGFKSALGWYMP